MSLTTTEVLASAGVGARGCHWIEGDDYLERIHRGEEIYCGAPTLRAGGPYCAVHHKRAYVDPDAPDREQQREPPDFTSGQRQRFVMLRCAGLSFARAVDLAIRPPARLLLPRRPLVPRRLAA